MILTLADDYAERLACSDAKPVNAIFCFEVTLTGSRLLLEVRR